MSRPVSRPTLAAASLFGILLSLGAVFAAVPDPHASTSTPVAVEEPVVLLPDTPADDADAPIEERYGDFVFRCPQRGPQTLRPNPPDTRVHYGCPLLVEDELDFFGNLDLALHPGDPGKIAFFSLHGEPDPDGPSSRSRAGMTHTTFLSPNAGTTWYDHPWGGDRGELGEEAAGVIDSSGNLYIGYLWSRPLSESEDHLNAIRIYKGGTLDGARGSSIDYSDPWTFDGREQEVRLKRLGLTLVVPAGDDTASAPFAANETTAPPSGEDEVGDAAVAGNLTEEVVLATWLVEAPDWQNSTVGLARWIDAAWTGTGTKNEWEELHPDRVIGPCRGTSEAVAYKGKAYIACSVDKGYDHTNRARIGDIHIWTIDPSDGKTELVGDTRIRGENPLLTVTADGYFVVVAYEHEPPHHVSIETAYGWYGDQWSSGRITGGTDLGPELHRLAGFRPLKDMHVTNVVVTEKEKTIFLLYGEWNEPQGLDPQALEAGSAGSADKDLQKILFAFNECQPAVASLRMNHTAGTVRVGSTTSAATVTRGTYPAGAFNDARDGMVYMRDPLTDEELVYFAINDHGLAQFGAIVVEATGSPCPVVLPLPLPPAVPVPQALSLSTASMVAAGSSVGVISSLMIGYLLTVKRRTAQYTTVEDR